MKRFVGVDLVVAALLLASLAAADDLAIPFEFDRKHALILVKAKVNSKPALLILDTGASHTVLSSTILGVNPMELKLARFSAVEPGFRGESTWGEATLRLGKNVWYERRVVIMNLDNVSRRYGRKVDGLLGQDILGEFDHVVIDFKSQKIELTR